MSLADSASTSWSTIVSAGFTAHYDGPSSSSLEDGVQKKHYLADLETLARGECDTELIHRLVKDFRSQPSLVLRLNRFIVPNYRLECSRICSEIDFYVLVEGGKAAIRTLSPLAPTKPLPTSSDDVLNLVARGAEWDSVFNEPRQWLESFAQLLQEVLDGPVIDHSSYKAIRRLLMRLATEQCTIPPSVFFDFDALGISNLSEMISTSQYVQGGGRSDIYRVQVGKALFCVRSVRSTLNDDVERTRRSFCKEAAIWHQLKHPNIAQLQGIAIDASDTHRLHYFIMPLFPFGSLLSFLRVKPNHDKVSSIIQIVNGLAYLHGLDPPVVHGDLSATKILVDNNEICVLSGFGSADILDPLESYPLEVNAMKVTKPGALYWMAPEVTKDEQTGRDGRPRDVYSLGCTIYEVLTLTPLKPIFPSHVHENPLNLPPEGNWSPQELDVWALVGKCVDITPSERPLITAILVQLRNLSPTGDSISLERAVSGLTPLGIEDCDVEHDVEPRNAEDDSIRDEVGLTIHDLVSVVEASTDSVCEDPDPSVRADLKAITSNQGEREDASRPPHLPPSPLLFSVDLYSLPDLQPLLYSNHSSFNEHHPAATETSHTSLRHSALYPLQETIFLDHIEDEPSTYLSMATGISPIPEQHSIALYPLLDVEHLSASGAATSYLPQPQSLSVDLYSLSEVDGHPYRVEGGVNPILIDIYSSSDDGRPLPEQITINNLHSVETVRTGGTPGRSTDLSETPAMDMEEAGAPEDPVHVMKLTTGPLGGEIKHFAVEKINSSPMPHPSELAALRSPQHDKETSSSPHRKSTRGFPTAHRGDSSTSLFKPTPTSTPTSTPPGTFRTRVLRFLPNLLVRKPESQSAPTPPELPTTHTTARLGTTEFRDSESALNLEGESGPATRGTRPVIPLETGQRGPLGSEAQDLQGAIGGIIPSPARISESAALPSSRNEEDISLVPRQEPTVSDTTHRGHSSTSTIISMPAPAGPPTLPKAELLSKLEFGHESVLQTSAPTPTRPASTPPSGPGRQPEGIPKANASNFKSNPGQDVVVICVGKAGSGKSRFIEELTGQRPPTGFLQRLFHGAQTRSISAHRVPHTRLVLVDTPGYDTNRGRRLGEDLGEWVHSNYNVGLTRRPRTDPDSNFKLYFAYFQSIQQTRQTDEPDFFLQRQFRAQELVFVTTMWNKPTGSRNREELEREYNRSWEITYFADKPMPKTQRFYGTSNSARSIAREFGWLEN